MRSEVMRFGAFVQLCSASSDRRLPRNNSARQRHEVKTISEWTDALSADATRRSMALSALPRSDGFVVIIDTFQAGQATHTKSPHMAVVATLAGVEKDTRYAVPADLGGPPSLITETFSRTGDVNIFMEGNSTPWRACLARTQSASMSMAPMWAF